MELIASYRRLPQQLWSLVALSPAPMPECVSINLELAKLARLDVDWLQSGEGLAMLSGSAMPPGVTPVAQAYAGHQFGRFVPSLGDGRAMLLGAGRYLGGERFEMQLKGAGRTVWSREGDGRAPIGPVLREYLVSEAMHALGVKTTRALVAVATGEDVLRDRALPGAVITRLSRSFMRVGSFQYAACRQDHAALLALVRLAARDIHGLSVPEESPDDAADRLTSLRIALLDSVVHAQADLIAHWMSLGFVHGVMNTDNMSIAGETLDYGPCAFLDRYEPERWYSGIDRGGRYAYRNQPDIARWNLVRFAEALILSEDDEAIGPMRDIVADYPARYARARRLRFGKKLGLSQPDEADQDLIDRFLDILEDENADFTESFQGLPTELGSETPSRTWRNVDKFKPWVGQWAKRVEAQSGGRDQALTLMSGSNPAVISRNHLVEKALSAAEDGEIKPFQSLLDAVTRPFERHSVYGCPPERDQEVRTTWCGT